jgi:surface antigen
MRSRGISCLFWGICFFASLILSTRPSPAANCALYARAETGVALYGAAGRWWDEAEGRYARGHIPAPGAIVVFKRTGHMPSGHVAIVAKVVSADEILVDHANWRHGTVSRGMSVIDTSPNHDWTQVAVMDPGSGKHGRDNPTFGFIYPEAGPREIVDYVADQQRALSRAGLVRLAVAVEYLNGDAPNTVLIERHHTGRRIRTAWTTETRRSQRYLSTD